MLFSWLIITMIGFAFSVNAPAEPFMGAPEEMGLPESNLPDIPNGHRAPSNQNVKKFGLNKPVFYLSLHTLADVDTLYRIIAYNHRRLIQRTARESGQPAMTMQWFNSLKASALTAVLYKPDSVWLRQADNAAQLNRLRFLLGALLLDELPKLQAERSDSVNQLFASVTGLSNLRKAWHNTQFLKLQLTQHARPIKRWIPVIKWHGLDNQYHTWVFGDDKTRRGIIRGDFGYSYRDGQAIADKIGSKIKWSLLLSLTGMLLAYLISIPMGVYSAWYKGCWFDRISTPLLFSLYAIPAFFAGTLLLVLFANPDVLDWFPSSGIRDAASFDPAWPLLKRLSHSAPYLVLPIITYAYGSLAFISRLIRTGILNELSKDYIRTARAKGLPEWRVMWMHAFRNNLLPLVTFISASLPVVFSGSIIIEYVFSIPGLGLEIFQSVLSYDYPMIIAVFSIYGFLTITGYFIADLGYSLADPRIRFYKNKRQ